MMEQFLLNFLASLLAGVIVAMAVNFHNLQEESPTQGRGVLRPLPLFLYKLLKTTRQGFSPNSA